MQHASSYSPCQSFLATLLLCSLLLQSCGYANLDPTASMAPKPDFSKASKVTDCSSKGKSEEPLPGIPLQPAGPEAGGLSASSTSLSTSALPPLPEGASVLQAAKDSPASAGSREPQDQPATRGPEGAARAQEARQALCAYYQQPAFAQVPSLFAGERSKHVDTLECKLLLVEQEPQATHEQRARSKTPIALEDLFKNRSTQPGGPAQAIQGLLLVGEPGTGKTTLSKKIASLWAQGKWGQEFNAVYVLPVRELQQSQYDNAHMRREATLPTAIANNCFHPPDSEEAYARLQAQISEELKKPTTLVVLDGLDERAGASEALLSQAKAGSHKLLMLSRPYGIEQERPLADLAIAHAGLSEGQMEAYVRGELSSDRAEELLSFIKEYPAMASTAHVPVNLPILCALWKDNQASVFFDTLGKLALDALQQDQVLISLEQVRDHMKDASFLSLQSGDSQYQFLPPTFQEYFAGRLLAKQLFSSEATVQEKAQKFFSKHQYAPQYGQMFSFLAGEVSKEQGAKGISKLLHMLNEGPQEVVGVQHLLLQLRLLNEWLCVAGKKGQKGLDKLEEEFHVVASLTEWFREGLDRVRRKDDRCWDNRRLLSLLTRGLQSARAVAGHASAQVLAPLIAACKAPCYDVRRVASEALGQLVGADPELAAPALPPLIAACKAPCYDVRRTVIKALGQIVWDAPALAEQALPPLIAACKDEDASVRSAAIKALGEHRKEVPALAPQVLPPLLAACKELYYNVRSAAIEALGQLVGADPALAAEALQPLIDACNKEEKEVRSAASEALGQFVGAVPAEQLLAHLIAACKNSAWQVRMNAISALGQLGKAAPKLAEQALKPLIAACEDKCEWVRMNAIKALGQLGKNAPQLAPQVLAHLLAACEDYHYVNRKVASEALGQLGKAAPKLAEQALKPLIAACKDHDWQTRTAALYALGQFSLAHLMDAYWATQDQVLIPIIATQLYHTPLSVQTIPHSQDQRLVLYPTAGQAVAWEQPQQAVQRFVQQIQGAAKPRR